MDLYVLSLEVEPEETDSVSDWIAEQFDTTPVEVSKPERRRLWLETYFEQEVEARLACEAVHRALGIAGVVRACPGRDWQEFWKRHFSTAAIGKRFLVVPEWETEEAAERSDFAERLVILINPGLSFGTGKHFTTRFALESVEKHVRAGDAVYDAGTGSGIVALAAHLLGAARIRGVDHDELALNAARENLELNKSEQHIDLEVMDLTEQWIQGEWDVVVANIYGHLLIEIAPRLVQAATRVLVLTGIQAGEGDLVAEAYQRLGWVEVSRDSDHEWCGLVLQPEG